MKLITSPEPLPKASMLDSAERPYVFLAGSIEQDKAVNWQKQVKSQLGDLTGTLFNPRRAEWDASWGENDPRFIEQVQWELQAMYQADLIMMHFEPGTISPVTLLELGLYAYSGKLYVSCPEGYWRRGNVRAICNSVNIRMHDSLQELVETVRAAIGSFHAGFKPIDMPTHQIAMPLTFQPEYLGKK